MLESGFNPRPRTGGDTIEQATQADLVVSIRAPALLSVSIRAPARGATLHSRTDVSDWMFQSAPPHGGRLDTERRVPLNDRFQSAPPHGGRRSRHSQHARATYCFNPRPRTGGDEEENERQRALNRFQSAPPHGGRPKVG